MTTTIITDILGRLRAPFPESQISWKVGRKAEGNLGQALPYIDNRLVQNLLDEALGAQNWSNTYQEVVAGNRLIAVRCKISLKLDGEWVSKEDGAPLGDGDLAVKGVYSDAMKRAVVQWGIGRYLYAFNPPWIQLDDAGRLSRIPSLDEGMGTVEERKAKTAANEAAATTKTSAPAAVATEVTVEHKDKPAAVKAEPVPAQPSPQQEVLAPQAEVAATLQPKDNGAKPEQPQANAAPAATPAPAASAAVGSEGRKPTEADIVNPCSTFIELKGKIAKMPLVMLRNYINGPKGKEKLSGVERTVLLGLVDEAERATATA